MFMCKQEMSLFDRFVLGYLTVSIWYCRFK